MNSARSSVLRRHRLGCVALTVALHGGVGWAVVGAGADSAPQMGGPTVLQVSLIVPAPLPPSAGQPPSALPLPSPRLKSLPVSRAPAARAEPAAPSAQVVAAPSVVAAAPAGAPVLTGSTELAAPAAGPAPTATPESSAGVAGAPALGSVSQSIGVVCPVQVKPVMPSRALREGLEGSVTARLTVRAGKVIQVDITQAQPRGVFESAVRHAVQQYRCDSGGDAEVLATQVFAFKFD